MTDAAKVTRAWNLRKFPLDLKRKCQSIAAANGQTDTAFIVDVLKKVGFLAENRPQGGKTKGNN
jgi:hypothetical protein